VLLRPVSCQNALPNPASALYTLWTMRLAIAAAVNDEQVLRKNLAASPCIVSGKLSLHIEQGHPSAPVAINHALDHIDADVVVIAHQDVYLPKGWEDRLLDAMDRIARSSHDEWGVLGVYGLTPDGRRIGRCWSNGLGEMGESPKEEILVGSVDELVMALNMRHRPRFDESLPGYHLYGTDIVQTALRDGLASHVFDGPVIHNTSFVRLGGDFYRAYRYMQRKWQKQLPIQTPCLELTRSGYPMYRSMALNIRNRLLGRVRIPIPHEDPTGLAQELGYE